jgi:hypothetical protein
VSDFKLDKETRKAGESRGLGFTSKERRWTQMTRIGGGFLCADGRIGGGVNSLSLEDPMSKSTFLLALSLLVAIVWFGLAANHPRAAEETKPAVQKWEYKSVWGGALPGNDGPFNELGAEGWEACGFTTEPHGNQIVLFKRPK